MDKHTVIGLILIFIVIFGFSWLNKPSKEELARRQEVQDSIARVHEEEIARQLAIEKDEARLDSLAAVGEGEMDSTRLVAKFGDFAAAGIGVEKLDTVETEQLKMVFTNKGGQLKSVELIGEQRYDSLPYKLFDCDDASLNFTLVAHNRILNTKDLYFETEIAENDSQKVVLMKLPVAEDKWFGISYILPREGYMTQMSIEAHNLEDVLAQNVQSLDMQWDQLIRQNEKGRKFELRYSTLNYKYTGDDVERLSEGKSDRDELKGKVHWIAFKDHFFSTIMIADESFSGTMVESEVMPEKSEFIRHHKMQGSVVFDPRGEKATNLQVYFGPNRYKTLRSFDEDLEKDERLELFRIIPMGWKIFSWITTLIIIPMFNLLGSWFTSYGIIILLMTIIIKIVVFPLMYKSFMSSAKMRVLRPQIEKINEKYPADKAMERQQATMALYQKAGVSPMSGCIPMLLQWPVLFAMFSFFPTCFELRGQSFLWAQDLSSYDAIVSWNAHIPIISSIFGNHISLFCLLMTITNIIYTKLNMAGQASNDPSANMMKWMMYLMPLMFMFMFNNYASGLSYYYFVSLLITILQTYLFRAFVDEKKVLEKMEKNAAKPGKKKSGFMARLEAAQKAQQEAMKKQMAEQQRKQYGGNSKGRH